MERREKSVERGEGGGLIVEKLKEGVVVGKRGGGGGPSTPSPTWRLELPSQQNCSSNSYVQEFLNFPTSSTISARKLCANLWEQQHHAPLLKMNNPATRIRCRRLRCRRFTKQFAEPPDYPSDQPESASSLKRHVAASLVEHHRSIQRNGCALLPESPGYSSSVNAAPYNHVATPTSSLDFKGMIGESSHSVKTSTELLKILNRIWSLEEQHASNVSVVKGLKMELGHSQARLKELLREKQMNRHEMENLMKQMTVDKLFRKNKEHDRTKAVIQSIKEELEDERRLRKHSESLHHKLARELAEVKSSFSGCLRNLERERKARNLLENLCDEFAKGIKDYEQEVHYLTRSSENSQVKENNSLDKLILHISEAWLDERVQMKPTQSSDDLRERSSIVDKLGFDIETFLHAKRSVDLKKLGYSSPELKEIYPCQHSLDSFPPKESTSAPRNIAQEDSIDTNFYEPKISAGDELHKLSSRLLQRNNITEVHLEKKGKQVQSKEINEDMSYMDNENRFVEKKSSEIVGEDTALLNEEGIQGPPESDKPWPDNLVGNSSLSSEGDKVYPESICRVDSCVQSAVTTDGSPVKLWKLKLAVSDFDMSESSAKLPKGVKENTLMAKLLEARLEGQKSRARANKSTS
ncbi:hypothetical protein RIF29_15346 [Crotalaria pallida]|uniref:Intracellular protein transporter USO1-like protein n=1 Tax=Crotalaria pallida TaxID=3830 RepID=A0AAN9FLL1_CROPI